jgi:hypothetical protein
MKMYTNFMYIFSISNKKERAKLQMRINYVNWINETKKKRERELKLCKYDFKVDELTKNKHFDTQKNKL